MQDDKRLGCIYGHILGDAVGVTTRFKPSADVAFPSDEPIRGRPPGDWTFNTDQLLLIMCKDIPGDFPSRLLSWYRGELESRGLRAASINQNTSFLLSNAEYIADPQKAAASMWEMSKKQFASAECLSRAVVCNEEDLLGLILATHADPRCLRAAKLYHNILRRLEEDPVPDIDKLLRDSIDASGARDDTELSQWVQTAFTGPLSGIDLNSMQKTNYVYRGLACGVYALQVIKMAIKHNKIPCFKKMIAAVACCGGSADINCALAGAVIGAYLGHSKLPQEWIGALPTVCEPIIIEYVSRCCM